MNRALPLFARIYGKVYGAKGIASCASETVELAPAVERFQPAAISLPNEINRVVGFQEETNQAIEMGRIEAGVRKHLATLAYRIDNAVFADSNLYFSGGYSVLRPKAAKPLLPAKADHFAEAQLCTHPVVARYFGHWIRDGLLLELLANQRGVPALTDLSPPWLHEASYRELVDLTPSKSNHARVERLWVVDDRGVNENWIGRLQELRRRVQSVRKMTGPRRVMLTRGKLGKSRNLVNAEEVQKILTSLDFVIIDPESESVRRIVETLAYAELAILVEGSSNNHCLMAMPPRSTLLTIQPPSRFNALSKCFADPLDLRWGFIVADQAAGGFHLPIDRLLRTLEEIARVS